MAQLLSVTIMTIVYQQYMNGGQLSMLGVAISVNLTALLLTVPVQLTQMAQPLLVALALIVMAYVTWWEMFGSGRALVLSWSGS